MLPYLFHLCDLAFTEILRTDTRRGWETSRIPISLIAIRRQSLAICYPLSGFFNMKRSLQGLFAQPQAHRLFTRPKNGAISTKHLARCPVILIPC